jgi:hypothetical protein
MRKEYQTLVDVAQELVDAADAAPDATSGEVTVGTFAMVIAACVVRLPDDHVKRAIVTEFVKSANELMN